MTLKIGIIGDPPFVNPCWKKNCMKPGMLMDICQLLCSESKLSCTFEEIENNNFGNASYAAMIERVAEGKYDTATPIFTRTPERAEIVNFSDDIIYMKLLLVFRVPSPDQLSLKRLLSLDWKAWLCVSICAIIIGLILSFTEWRPLNRRFTSKTFLNGLNAFVLLTNQGQDFHIFRTSSRVLWVFWALSALVVSTFYTGNLLAFLVKAKITFPFYTVDEFVQCIESHHCKLGVHSFTTSSMITLLYNYSKPPFDRLERALAHNPVYVQSANLMPKAMLNSNNPVLVWMTPGPMFYSATRSNVDCLFTSIESGLEDRYRFPIYKNSTYHQLVMNFSKTLRPHGITTKVYRRYHWKDTRRCGFDSTDEGKPLRVGSLFSLLFVLAIGFLISSITFISEKISRRHYKIGFLNV